MEDHATGHRIVDFAPEHPPQGCPRSIGITVRLPSESVAAFPRIPHQNEAKAISPVRTTARAAEIVQGLICRRIAASWMTAERHQLAAAYALLLLALAHGMAHARGIPGVADAQLCHSAQAPLRQPSSMNRR
jgi:hypothetical protein